ncbi:glycosyl transferase [Sphaerisporangium melleum]|uniref:Glycosyl transferase n=1 Tax=Sphaerisporangium melleum TaxID=321316 RepID=A0A917VHT7_9ACTN|nr:glycosyltransferase family 4 protein [Sphaerisporangium melleum]GGK84309.1 glycosyl transferase [Sphaerisporangium melleum]GII70388.1 glycosyl transferase [Sphaerisporangium melleum]
MAETARRVALVLGTSTGGVGRHVRMLAEGLAREGHRVVVAGPASTEAAFGFSTVAPFAEVPVSDRPRPAADARAVLRLRALTAGADVVHAHGLRAGALAALALTGRRAALVVTLHNALTTSGVIGAVYGLLERIVARRAHLVLVVAPDLGERMAARGARRVAAAVVPAPPLRPPARPAAEVRAGLRPPGHEQDTGPILLTIARLAQQKGLSTLLDAARGPYGQDAAAPLFVVAGEGPLRGALQERIDAEALPVRLLGDRADVADLLGAADAVIVPSRWEGQPLSVQEALRAGRPIIATAVGGIPGMVGDAALLVPPGDAAALRAQIAGLLGDPGLAGRLSAAAAARPLPGEQDALSAAVAAYEAARQAAGGHG